MTVKRDCLQEGLRILGRRPCSCLGMRKTLRQKGYSEEQTEECIKQLSGWGYLNDERFAQERITHYREKGKGREYIAGYLVENGFAENDIRRYLAFWYPLEEEQCVAQRIAQKRLGKVEDPSRKDKMRLLRNLTAAGFTEEAIRACGYADEDS